MNAETRFVDKGQPSWHAFEALLAEESKISSWTGEKIADFARRHRNLCGDLTRARTEGYSNELITFLDVLAGRGHNALYGRRRQQRGALSHLLLRAFPQTFRNASPFMLTAALAFILPLLFGAWLGWGGASAAEGIVPPQMLHQMAEAYSSGFSSGRDEGTDSLMAGFYVYNNVSIAFRCFATGIFFGLGSLWFLIYNGLTIGTVLGYVAHAGHGLNIITFVTGHGAFELTAIVVAGAAGLQMGHALIVTDGLTRAASLRRRAPELARLITGAAVMLVIAALIEAYWSPSSIPNPVKWGAAVCWWLGVMAYFAFVGRGRSEASSG